MKTLSKLSFILMLSVALVFGFNFDAKASTVHTVQPGDTMWKIAMKYQVGVPEIINANGQISNPNFIYPGQR